MKTVRKLLWLNGWLVFAFLFLGGMIYFGYYYMVGDSIFTGPDQRLSSLVAELNDLSNLRTLFQSHIETEQQIARAQSSTTESVVSLAVLLSVCGAVVALVNFIVLRRVRAIDHDEL